MSLTKRLTRWLGIPLVLLALLVPSESHALRLNKDVKDVMVFSGYGLIGGTAVGLAILPLTQDLRVALMGSSIGLYLGIVAGVFYVVNRTDPGNPLRGFDAPEKLPPTLSQVRFDLPWLAYPVVRF